MPIIPAWAHPPPSSRLLSARGGIRHGTQDGAIFFPRGQGKSLWMHREGAVLP